MIHREMLRTWLAPLNHPTDPQSSEGDPKGTDVGPGKP